MDNFYNLTVARILRDYANSDAQIELTRESLTIGQSTGSHSGEYAKTRSDFSSLIDELEREAPEFLKLASFDECHEDGWDLKARWNCPEEIAGIFANYEEIIDDEAQHEGYRSSELYRLIGVYA